MPGSPTTQDRTGTRVIAPVRVAFRIRNCVGVLGEKYFVAQWLACMLPCQRFAAPSGRYDLLQPRTSDPISYRGRDAHCCAPPAQIPAGVIHAPGSHLGCLTAKRTLGHG
jgi:hypothetical protein